jgi:uncharacterized C2H2 Zn-finger protein
MEELELCPICGEVFESSDELGGHQQREHDGRTEPELTPSPGGTRSETYLCPTCDMLFGSREELEIHQQTPHQKRRSLRLPRVRRRSTPA